MGIVESIFLFTHQGSKNGMSWPEDERYAQRAKLNKPCLSTVYNTIEILNHDHSPLSLSLRARHRWCPTLQ
jgi:hypothetical protein